MDIAEAAGVAEKAVEGFMRVEPTMATMASMFVPGAAPIVAVVHPLVAMAAPFVEKALLDIAQHHNGDAFSAFIELIQHVTRGMPNSNVLTPAHDASTAGSG